MVDGIAQDGKLDLGVNMEHAQPFQAFVDAGIQIKLVRPVLAQLPLLADPTHRKPDFLGTGERIEDVITVGLGKEVIDHAIADMLAVGAVKLADDRLHGRPDLVDQFEVLICGQFSTDTHRVLQVGHQHRNVGQHRQAFLQQVTDDFVAALEQVEQIVVA